MVISASKDKTIKIWNVETGEEIRTFVGHTKEVNDCAFSPDGSKIVSASEDNTLRLWDVNINSESKILTSKRNSIAPRSCVFSSDGKFILYVNWSGFTYLLDVNTGEEIRRYKGLSSIHPLASICNFSPDGTKVVSALKEIMIWDFNTGEIIKTFVGHSSSVKDCAFSPNGDLLVTVSVDNTLKIWDVKSNSNQKNFEDHSHEMSVPSVIISPDGLKILSAGFYGDLKLWDAKTFNLLRKFERDKGIHHQCNFSPDGKRIISCGKRFKILDTLTGTEVKIFSESSVVGGCAFTPDGKYIITFSLDGIIRYWDPLTFSELKTIQTNNKKIRYLAISPDSSKIACAFRSKNDLILWDLESGLVCRKFIGHSDSVNHCVFHQVETIFSPPLMMAQ